MNHLEMEMVLSRVALQMHRKAVRSEGNGEKGKSNLQGVFLLDVASSPPSERHLRGYTDGAADHVGGSTDCRVVCQGAPCHCIGEHRPLLNQCGCPTEQVTSTSAGTFLLPLPNMP